MTDEKVIVMSALECGAYIRLLCVAWNSHPIGTLIGSPSSLAKFATLTDREWEDHGIIIMAPFELIDGRWCQKRMMEEGRLSEEKHDIFVESGRRGGLAKACLKSASSNHSHNHNKNKDTVVAAATQKPFKLQSDQPSKTKKSYRQPSSYEEFKAYCASRGINDTDTLGLYSGWEANGWTRNGEPLKKWKAAVVNWQVYGYLPSQKSKR